MSRPPTPRWGGAPSSRPAPVLRPAADGPEPGASWATVCFRPPGAAVREVGFGGLVVPVRSVLWRSHTAHGPALVRSDALSFPAGGGAGRLPYGRPSPCLHPPGRLPCDVHLRADPDEPGPPDLKEQADVLVSRVPLPPPAARRRLRELLGRHPGCLVAAVPDPLAGCHVGVRDAAGGVRCALLDAGGPRGPVPPHVVVSVVHAWTAAGGPPGALCSVTPMPGG